MKNTTSKKIHSVYKNDFGRILVYNAIFILCLLLCASHVSAEDSYISTNDGQNLFPLVANRKAAALCVSSQDYPGVLRVAGHLQKDIREVAGIETQIVRDEIKGENVVIIGTIGKNPIIDKLIQEKKINAKDVAGKWDTFALQTVENPLPNINRALVIFGCNKRGTIYGMYDLSAQIGVSPWYWWADVPVKKKDELYVKSGFYSPGEPKVKYRGIFINDENPCLTKWVVDNYGAYNHKFYEKVYELILRNKGNYLWPAMWPGPKEVSAHAFFDDDPKNHQLADEFGVVIATTHHEPMMRAAHEWHRSDNGVWDYTKNKERLQKFWRNGIERMGDYESVVTVGMRGDGDTRMPGGTQVELMQTIIEDQREIIADVTGKPAEETPQVWAIYKEVQDYYDKGTRVDEDITILFCDDNWGNIKCLPKKDDLKRSGGFGIYYHFDYVGGPVSYKWTNVTQIERTWEQMNLAYQWGAKEIWIVNVGDIKPHELPISFFLDFAWNPEAIGAEDLPNYYIRWAQQQFGDEYAKEIGEILSLYTKYNARRTPEMMSAEIYSVEHYREADRVVNDYKQLYERAKAIYDKLPETHKSGYYQLVLFPVESNSNLLEMYVSAAKNKFYTKRGASQSANYYADKTKELFYKDDELNKYINEDLENGKWNHMFNQAHIGHHLHWYQPAVNNMPPVAYTHTTGEPADLGFHVEYGTIYHFGGVRFDGIKYHYHNKLPQFDPVNNQDYYIEIFNKGDEKLSYTLKAKQDWIKLSKKQGTIQYEEKVYVSIDWQKAPKGRATGKVMISGGGAEYTVDVPIRNDLPQAHGFVENNGVVSIEAAHFDNAVNTRGISWVTIPNLGRTHSAVTVAPYNADRQTPGEDSPHLEYTFSIFDSADVELATYLSPTYNFKRDEGSKFAVSIDDEEPQIVNMHEGSGWWNKRVGDHIAILTTKHKGLKPGQHTLKLWMVDPGIVFQKFVMDVETLNPNLIEPTHVYDSPVNFVPGLKPSYLGPPESVYLKPSNGEQ